MESDISLTLGPSVSLSNKWLLLRSARDKDSVLVRVTIAVVKQHDLNQLGKVLAYTSTM